mmetsp:Transcript_28881/g.63651  ORF Transcript_28881/g.63651 Transcript_28881/m.63651 type:complete len:232 (-) Transcript_28881:402-1097(-)
MEAQDVLSDDVHRGRPAVSSCRLGCCSCSFRQQAADVAVQSIKPHVDCLLRVLGDGDAPSHCCSRDGEVLHSLLYPCSQLVTPSCWLHELAALRKQLLNLLLVLAEPEEVVALLPVLAGLAVRGAVVLLVHLLFVLELLTVNAVPALIVRLVDVTLVPYSLQHLAHNRLVLCISGSDEVIKLDVQLLPQCLVLRHDIIAVLLGSHAALLSCQCNLLPVLVSASQEVHRLAL